MTENEMQWVAITEHCAEWRGENFQIQLEERLAVNVFLSGIVSKNGHRYAEAALREAVDLYAQKPVFLDHAANLSKPFDRSMRDLAGWITAARYHEGRIQGDIQVVDTEAGRTLLALMSAETPSVGMSHVILAKKSADGTLVENIHDVISVDAVMFPATTSGFREQMDLPEGDSAAEQEYERRLQELKHELHRVIAERDALRQQHEAFSEERCQQTIDQELSQAGLPTYAVTKTLREQLRSSRSAEQRSLLIAEQRQLVLQCQQRMPNSRPRDLSSVTVDDISTRRFVQAIKGQR